MEKKNSKRFEGMFDRSDKPKSDFNSRPEAKGRKEVGERRYEGNFMYEVISLKKTGKLNFLNIKRKDQARQKPLDRRDHAIEEKKEKIERNSEVQDSLPVKKNCPLLKVLVNGNRIQMGMYSISPDNKISDDFEFWDLQTLEKKTTEFVNHLRELGYEPIFFFDHVYCDADWHSQEYLDNMTNQMKNMKRPCPPNISILYFYMLRSMKVEAHLCLYGMKETIAYRSKKDEGTLIFSGRVNSEGRIIFKKYESFKTFITHSEYLSSVLNNQWEEGKRTHEYQTLSRKVKIFPLIENLKDEKLIQDFGHPTPLLRIYNSPYPKMSGLYATLYKRAGINKIVTHNIPVWNEEGQCCSHSEEIIDPEKATEENELLDDYEKAIESLFNISPKSMMDFPENPNITRRMWRNHIFCIYSIMILLWINSQKETEDRNLFDEFNKLIKTHKYFKDIQGANDYSKFKFKK